MSLGIDGYVIEPNLNLEAGANYNVGGASRMAAMSQWESSNCLLLLFGIPGAGKTRLATELRDISTRRENWKFMHICVDQFQSVDQRTKLARGPFSYFKKKSLRPRTIFAR